VTPKDQNPDPKIFKVQTLRCMHQTLWLNIPYVDAKVSRWLDWLYLVWIELNITTRNVMTTSGEAHQRNSVLSPFSCNLLLRIRPRTLPTQSDIPARSKLADTNRSAA